MNKTLKGAEHVSLINATSCVCSNRLPSRIHIAQNKNDIILNEHPDSKTNSLFISAFTLVELMVTLTVLCLLLVFAIPAFKNMLMNNRINANADGFVDALNYARNTALNQSVNTMVCPFGAVNSTGCGGNWSSGWIVITQPASGAPTLLKSQQSAPNDPTLTANVVSVLFDSHGLSTAQSNFKICDSRGGEFGRSVEVLATGFVQSGSTPGQAVWDDSALTCP